MGMPSCSQIAMAGESGGVHTRLDPRHKHLLLVTTSRLSLFASIWLMLFLSVVVGLELDETAPRDPSSEAFSLLLLGIAVLELVWLAASLIVRPLRRNHRVALTCFALSAAVPFLAVALNLLTR